MQDSDRVFESIIEKTDIWRDLFFESPHFALLAEEQKEVAGAVIEPFISYMFYYEDQGPDEWTVTAMKSCCLETLPSKISAGEELYKQIAKVLEAYFLFLDDNKFIKKGEMLARNVIKLEKAMIDAFEDPSNWGMAKSLFMPALDMGIDLDDKDEIDKYIQNYNMDRIKEYNETVVKPFQIGRNDPCPCGSGKKYKKCCGK